MYKLKSFQSLDIQNYINKPSNKALSESNGYILILVLQLSSLNESDNFTILLNQTTIYSKNLYVNKSYICKNEILINKNYICNFDNIKISILNNSDDVLAIDNIKGGICMAGEESSIDIKSISNINNKSIDIELNIPFEDDFKATIKSLNTNVEYPCKLVENSLNTEKSIYKKTLLIGEIDTLNQNVSPEYQNLINLKLPSNQQYEVTLAQNTAPFKTITFTFDLGVFSPITNIDDITVNTIGDRILSISFKYPVQNIFETITIDDTGKINNTGTSTILNNFYALYFERDINSTIDVDKVKWSVLFDLTNPFLSAYLSSDGKTLFLEDTFNNMPLTNANHHLLGINIGKYHTDNSDKNSVLTDYTEEKRIIPAMEIPFEVSKYGGQPEALEATSLSRNKIIISFNKPIMVPTLNDINHSQILLDKDGNKLELKDIVRVENDLTKLLFILEDPLETGLTNISVGSPLYTRSTADHGDLIDVDGYIVPRKTLEVCIISETPYLKEVIQNRDVTNTSTVLDLYFSAPMSDDDITGADIKENYTLVDANGNVKDIESAEFIDEENSEVKLVMSETLPPGDYFLIIKEGAVTDDTGTPIAYTQYSIKLIDTIIPVVTEILALERAEDNTGTNITNNDNALIIKYNTAMSTSGECAANDNDNYKFVAQSSASTNTALSPETAIETLKNNKWIRFTLPVTPSIYPVFEDITDGNEGKGNPDYIIYVGYESGNKPSEFKYVCNTSGIMLNPFSLNRTITAAVPLIDLGKAEAEFPDDHTLVYNYTDGNTVDNAFYHNEFHLIDESDFLVQVSSDNINYRTLEIKDVKIAENGTTIRFTFSDGTFDVEDKFVRISLTPNNGIKDIFGKGILADASTDSGFTEFNDFVLNTIPTKLLEASLTKLEETVTSNEMSDTLINKAIVPGYVVQAALKFDQPILYTHTGDFKMTFENKEYGNIPIEIVQIAAVNNPDTVLVEGFVPYNIYQQVITDDIYIGSIADSNLIKTISNTNRAKMEPFDYRLCKKLTITNAYLKFVKYNDLENATVTFEFSDDIIGFPDYIFVENTEFKKEDNENDEHASNIHSKNRSVVYGAKLDDTITGRNYGKLIIKKAKGLKLFKEDIASSSETDFCIEGRKTSPRTIELKFKKANKSITDPRSLELDNMDILYKLEYWHSQEVDGVKYSLLTDSTGTIYANISPERNAAAVIRNNLMPV